MTHKNVFFISIMLGAGLVMSACHEDSPGCDATTCTGSNHCEGDQCVPNATAGCDATTCTGNNHCEGDQCVPNATAGCDATTCTGNNHCEGDQCVPNATTGCDATTCTGNRHCEGDQCVENVGADPCKGVSCVEGTCSEGVCVTDAMRKVKADSPCNPETFVDFCSGKDIVYCDVNTGLVVRSSCDERCVIYEDSVWGRRDGRLRAGCVDGGACSELNEVKKECMKDPDTKESIVFATACQKTTRNTLEYISVDGFVCQGACNAKGNGCAAYENSCDPYEFVDFCDGQTLTKCFLNSQLIPIVRDEFCEAKCSTFGNGVASCGLAECTEQGELANVCGLFDSTNDYDVINTVCVPDKNGKLYRIRTGLHDMCEKGCIFETGECK